MLKKDNIIDIGNNKSINFNDILDFSKDIKTVKLIILIKKKNTMKNLKILKKI